MSRVLLVEDDEGIGRGLAASLATNGHDVDWQRTGASALRAVAKSKLETAS